MYPSSPSVRYDKFRRKHDDSNDPLYAIANIAPKSTAIAVTRLIGIRDKEEALLDCEFPLPLTELGTGAVVGEGTGSSGLLIEMAVGERAAKPTDGGCARNTE